MKTLYSLVALLAAGALAMGGCGAQPESGNAVSASNTTSDGSSNASSNVTTGTSSNDEPADSTAASSGDTAAIRDGVTKMLSVARDLKDAIAAGDDAKIKATGPKLEDTWSSFEDSVRPKYPDLYEEVEKYLDPAVAGSQADKPDKALLAKLDKQLTQALQALLDKVNS
ncbi:MAG: hypothetical protein K6T30_03770 [Alicyclobacillus sp.]|nr:hypothetical protein [Alicyclobacillus sp.]